MAGGGLQSVLSATTSMSLFHSKSEEVSLPSPATSGLPGPGLATSPGCRRGQAGKKELEGPGEVEEGWLGRRARRRPSVVTAARARRSPRTRSHLARARSAGHLGTGEVVILTQGRSSS